MLVGEASSDDRHYGGGKWVESGWSAFEFADRVSGRKARPLIQPALSQYVRLQTGGSPSIRQLRHHLCAKPDRHYTRHSEQRNLRRA